MRAEEAAGPTVSELRRDMLAYCETSRTKTEILDHTRCDRQVADALLRQLVGQGKIMVEPGTASTASLKWVVSAKAKAALKALDGEGERWSTTASTACSATTPRPTSTSPRPSPARVAPRRGRPRPACREPSSTCARRGCSGASGTGRIRPTGRTRRPAGGSRSGRCAGDGEPLRIHASLDLRLRHVLQLPRRGRSPLLRGRQDPLRPRALRMLLIWVQRRRGHMGPAPAGGQADDAQEVVLMQATLYDFAPRAVPVEAWGWDHDHPHRWLYRSNAEAVVKDLGKMPSGAGIWPRLMRNCQPAWHWGCDFTADQFRGDGGIRKAIWADGRVVDCIHPRNDNDYGNDTRIKQAWIEDDTLRIVGDDGIERYLDILEDSECHWSDRTGFHPDTIVQHYGILALSKGVTGDAISAIVGIHSYMFDTVRPQDPRLDLIWSTIPTTGVVPKLSYAVHHITEFLGISPVQYTCATCTRRRPHKGCQCGSTPDTGYCLQYIWDGTPIKRLRKAVAEEDEDDDMEACCA